jgi:hypothetical protein
MMARNEELREELPPSLRAAALSVVLVSACRPNSRAHRRSLARRRDVIQE